MKILLVFIIHFTLFAEDKTALIKVTGMTCPMCTTAIKKSLKKVDGVIKAKVKLNTAVATVTFREKVTQGQLLKAIADVGYKGEFISVK
ncbi:heavy-metal-associated domain-containing protein [Sulfurovum sp. ST-21]|uniref:Heavy-metal-associated domain-containing protein n=1 Tax=Sulfurovum indicum TaxID=2779528 RepID=A0A7M1S3F1_9BACT|nr:heavy metal-associated domain-containing protein [Sulfurovum indicum]QOR61249.1 heavy-metal-associated domain-containing protein [Sulfurovum indicum]